MRRIAPPGLVLAIVVVGGACGLDLLRLPENQLSARAAVALIDVYRTAMSPLLSRAGVRCRFEPSCSEYARASIRARGVAAGGRRSLARLARCGPWTPPGAVDPVSGDLPAHGGQPTARVEGVVAARPVEDPGVGERPRPVVGASADPFGVTDGDGLAC